MEQIKKQEYEAPQVEMLNARVEKGFAGSFIAGSTVGDPVTEGDSYGNDIFNEGARYT